MPRYMMFVIPGPGEHTTEGPTVEMVEAMTRYNEELVQAGAMLAGDGLTAPSEGIRITWGDGAPTVTDGPFAEAKEMVGGYWIIQAASREEAVEWGRRCPLGGDTILEIRRIAEMSDFPEDVQEAAQLSQTPPEQTRA
jgi:hypothetical protein